MPTRTTQENRLGALAMKRLWESLIQQRLIPDLGDRPAGYLSASLFGTAITNSVTLGHEENPMNNGLMGEGMVHWYTLGSPTFQLTTSAVESFMLTDVTNLTVGDMALPFPAFFVRLPTQHPLVFIDGNSQERQVRDVWVHVTELPRLPKEQWGEVMDRISEALMDRAPVDQIRALEREFNYGPHLVVNAEGDDAHGLVRTFPLDDPRRSFRDWVNPDFSPIGVMSDWKNDKSKYTIGLVCRVLANLCLWLDGSDTQTGKPNWSGPTVQRKPSKGLSKTETYVVGRDIHLPVALKDAARAMGLADKDADARATWKLADRLLVRGHWRMQAYGPGSLQRRRTQIQPYWKGEDDAAILTRNFVVGKK